MANGNPTRVYLVLDGGAPRTQEQWGLLIKGNGSAGLKGQPMAAAIIAAAQSSPYNTVTINRYSLTGQYMLGDFEMRYEERAALLAVLEAERVAQGVADGLSTKETFRQVLLEEMKDVAVAEGYGALAPLLNVDIVGFGNRQDAIDEMQVWFTENVADWE